MTKNVILWSGDTMNQENLGPAERIIQTLISYTDHMNHGRPGVVYKDPYSVVGVKWEPVVCTNSKEVFKLVKNGNKTQKTRIGNLCEDNRIKNGETEVGVYRPSGIFPEVAVWMYKQISEVWKLDNEFAARWASYSFSQNHRDMKAVLAAFMLCQSRKGDPVLDGDKIAFHDDDFRDIGEAMILLSSKDFNPKLLLRIHEVLTLDGVSELNKELGFTKSSRNPFYGRYNKAIEKWLRYRERNLKVLEGLVMAGFRTSVIKLARITGYKPESSKFFEILRWKQKQSEDGRRQIAIGQELSSKEDWTGMSEKEICEKIIETKPNFKRVVGLLPKEIGITKAIMAASVEAGSLSNKDMMIFTPTLEELGLLELDFIKKHWEKAMKSADDMRSANIASRVKSKEISEKLKKTADDALKNAIKDTMKNIRVYFMVDISGSMEQSIESAKCHLTKFLQGFPQESIHISVFNTSGRVITIKNASSIGVENAFKGITAGGGTDYGAGIRALKGFKPQENETVVFIFVGDEEANIFDNDVSTSGLNPTAFGLVKISHGVGTFYPGSAVQDTAKKLGIPCFMINEQTFSDPYAIPRTIKALIESTPVNKAYQDSRTNLVDTILKTELLKKPNWAA